MGMTSFPAEGQGCPRSQSASSTEGSAALGVGEEAYNEATPNVLPRNPHGINPLLPSQPPHRQTGQGQDASAHRPSGGPYPVLISCGGSIPCTQCKFLISHH